MSSTYFVRTPFTIVNIDIAHDEDWYDPVPQLLDEAGNPVDLTFKVLRLFVRPTFDHSVSMFQATSPDDGITIDSAANGYFTFNVPRATVVTEVPVGEWDQFLVMYQPGTPAEIEVWRGKLRVHPSLV